MRILVFSAYYEPEAAASLYLSTNLYEDMASKGMEVELYVPLPTRGVDQKLRNKYRKQGVEVKCGGRLRIHRVGIPGETASTMLRALRYLYMNLIFAAIAMTCKADAIFVQSTPPTQGAMAAVIKKWKRIPFVYNLQDVFPDSLVSTGITSQGSLLWRMGRVLEDFTYRNADNIIVISRDIKENIMQKGVPSRKIQVVYNWVNADEVVPVPRQDNPLFERFGLDRKLFYAVYAGNLGYAQNIEVILETAARMKRNPGIKFLIFGNGAQEAYYKKLSADRGLDNVNFFPLLPYREVSFVYSLGDVCILTCKNGTGKGAMPSKMWNIMSTGTPVLANFDSGTDVERLIEQEKFGIFTSCGNAKGMEHAIRRLAGDEELCRQMGDRGRGLIESQYSRQKSVQQYLEIIAGVKDKPPGRGGT